MADVNATSVHLPIEVWIANAALVHEDFQVDGGSGVTHPRIQNLSDFADHGVALGEYLDDETHMFDEPKQQIDVPVLTAVGSKLRDVKQLSGAETVQIPINAFSYTLYAIMQGLDPLTSIVNDENVKFDEAGYTAADTPSDSWDKVATMLDRMETIDTIRFALLAQVQPADPTLGDKYILCPKLTINMENIQQMVQTDYYKQTISLRAVILTAAELTRWQNIMPAIKKTIGMYSFHLDEPAS